MNLERRIDMAMGGGLRPRLGGKKRHPAPKKGKKPKSPPTKYKNQIEWGFKGLNLGVPGFKKLFKTVGISIVPFVKTEDGGETFYWTGRGITVATDDNPLTGWFDGQIVDDHIGYAHYVGIKGEQNAVMRAVKVIHQLTKHDVEEAVLHNPYLH